MSFLFAQRSWQTRQAKRSLITQIKGGRESEWQGRYWLTIGSEVSHRKSEVHNVSKPASAVLVGKRPK